jgi:hypothetical protein
MSQGQEDWVLEGTLPRRRTRHDRNPSDSKEDTDKRETKPQKVKKGIKKDPPPQIPKGVRVKVLSRIRTLGSDRWVYWSECPALLCTYVTVECFSELGAKKTIEYHIKVAHL